MINSKYVIFTSLLISFFAISFYQTQKSITMISNEKSSNIHLKTEITKQKLEKVKKLNFLNSFVNKDYFLTLQWKKFYFNKDLNFLVYGREEDLNLDWKKYLILNKSVGNIDNFWKIPYTSNPVHFLITRKHNDVTNSCKKGTFFNVKLLNNIKNKLEKKGINLFLMIKKDWTPITKDQIKVETNLTAGEGELLDILLSNKKCFFWNEGYDIKNYVFISSDFMVNKLDRKRGSYLASKKVIDVKRDSISWETLGYLYPRDRIEDAFTYKDNGGMDRCTVNYSVYNLCVISDNP